MRGKHQPGMKKGGFPGKAAFFALYALRVLAYVCIKARLLAAGTVYLFLSLAAPDSLGIRFPESPVCHDSRISG